MLYALLHLDRMQAPATSELIAQMLGTNALVVRRTMGGLRRAGIVFSVKGHGGGWSLARAGLDDAPYGITPDLEVWTIRRESWLPPVPGVDLHEQNPPPL